MNLKEKVEENPFFFFVATLILGLTTGLGVAQWGFSHGVGIGINENYILRKTHTDEVERLNFEIEESSKSCLKKLQTTIHLVDDKVEEERFFSLKKELERIPFIYVKPIPVNQVYDVQNDAKEKPEILIAHRRSFAKKVAGDKILVESIEKYYAQNKNINIVVYSASFKFPEGKSEFKAYLPGYLKNKVELIEYPYSNQGNEVYRYRLIMRILDWIELENHPHSTELK